MGNEATARLMTADISGDPVDEIVWTNCQVQLSQSGVNCRRLLIEGCDICLTENVNLSHVSQANIANCRIWLQGRTLIGGRIYNCVVYCNSRQPLCRRCNGPVPRVITKQGPRYGHYCSGECKRADHPQPVVTADGQPGVAE